MLQPDITIKTNEQLISLCSENKLLGNLIEVPSSQKGGDPILVNLTGEIRVSENDVLPQLFNFFRGSLLPRLKTFLVDLSMEWVNITARPFIFLMPITSDFENHSPVDNVLLKYALLSPNTRKSPKGYLKTIDDLGDREAMTARIVDEVMAQPNWADSLSPQTINKIEVDLLPALLLSNEHNIKHRGAKGLLEILLGNIDRVSDLKKKDADNPLVSLLGDGNLVFSTDGLKVSDRYQSSWLRNLYLRTITYGS